MAKVNNQRVFDNGGKTADRYTVLFDTRQGIIYVGMSHNPFYPLGVCLWGEMLERDINGDFSRLGKEIEFTDLPTDCQKAANEDYK